MGAELLFIQNHERGYRVNTHALLLFRVTSHLRSTQSYWYMQVCSAKFWLNKIVTCAKNAFPSVLSG
jgi:hypothetical protein